MIQVNSFSLLAKVSSLYMETQLFIELTDASRKNASLFKHFFGKDSRILKWWLAFKRRNIKIARTHFENIFSLNIFGRFLTISFDSLINA